MELLNVKEEAAIHWKTGLDSGLLLLQGFWMLQILSDGQGGLIVYEYSFSHQSGFLVYSAKKFLFFVSE